jgi:hypothetical protein
VPWYGRFCYVHRIVSQSSNTPAIELNHACIPASDTHDEHGVDLTLIDEMLCLDPIERLRLNDRAINAVLELRRGLSGQ